MESLKVRQDGTVRSAQEYIVEFSYGGDSADASKLEPVKLPLVRMSDRDVLLTYLYQLELPQPVGEIQKLLTAVRQGQQLPPELDEIRELLAIRDRLRQGSLHHLLPTLETTVYVGVNIQRLLQKVKDRRLCVEHDMSLTPFTVKSLVDMACQHISRRSSDETFHLVAYIRSTLSIKQVLHVHRLNAAELDWLLNSIVHKFQMTLVAPGEMVGTVAASSIGEPCTQMSVEPDTVIYVKEIREIRDSSDSSDSSNDSGTVRTLAAVSFYSIEDFVTDMLAKSDNVVHYSNTDTTIGSTSLKPAVLQEMLDGMEQTGSASVRFETLSVSTQGKVEWKPISGVTRHPPNGSMLRVRTQRGRVLTATMAKSWLIQGEDGGVVPAEGSQIRVGVKLPVLRQLKRLGDDTATNPLQLDLSALYPLGDEDFPALLDVSADLAFLLGIYSSRHFTAAGKDVDFCHTSPDCLARVQRYCVNVLKVRRWQLGLNSFRCKSRSLVKLLHKYAGQKWPHFFIPDYLHSRSDCLQGYLDGFFCGSMMDANWTQVEGLEYRPVWDQYTDVFHDLVFLLASAGVVPCVSNDKLVVPPEEMGRLLQHGSFTWKLLDEWARERALPVDVDQASDMEWDTVVQVEQLEPDSLEYEYVYDLTVEDNPTFVTGLGVFAMDTLNTFHSAGIAAKNVTLGVPRIKELVDASKKLKTPQVTLYLLPPLCHNEQLAQRFKDTLVWTVLADLVQQSHVLWCPPGYTDAADAATQELLLLNTPFLPFCQPQLQGPSNYVLRYLLDQDTMLDRGLEPVDVARCIEAFAQQHCQVVYSEANMTEWVILVRLEWVDDMAARVDAAPDAALRRHTEKSIMQRENQRFLNDVVIMGVPEVSDADLRRQKWDSIDASTGAVVSQEEWVIVVEGPVLAQLLQLDGVDTTRSYSNHPIEMAAVFGIETAVSVLLHELQKVLSFDGTYVNARHIMTLVNTMTHRDFIMPMTRHGINRVDYDLLQKASFEESVEILFEGASYKERVRTKEAVSANVILGQPVPLGTGSVTMIDPYTGREIRASSRAAVVKSDLDETLYDGYPVETQIGGDLDFAWFDPSLLQGRDPAFRLVPPPAPRQVQRRDSGSVSSREEQPSGVSGKRKRTDSDDTTPASVRSQTAYDAQTRRLQLRLGPFQPSTPPPAAPESPPPPARLPAFAPSTPPPPAVQVTEDGVRMDSLQSFLDYVTRITH